MKVGIFGLMFVVMFGLKVAGIITISWWLVTLPLYGPVVVAAVFAALTFLAYAGLLGKK
ncbi:hypothetical protein D3C85_1319030 [compost metagenome]